MSKCRFVGCSAFLILALSGCAREARLESPTILASHQGSVPPVETEGSVAPPISLAAIVTTDANLSAAAGTFAPQLTVYRTLAGAAAFRAAGVASELPAGFQWAMLTEFDRDDDHRGPHEDRYRSFAAAFETAIDAERAYQAAVQHHQSASGWGFSAQRDEGGCEWDPGLGDEGACYVTGEDYGYPALSVYLWRVDTLLLQAVDYHPYDLPDLLRSIARSMTARAVDAIE
jgi:hypothetical protein